MKLARPSKNFLLITYKLLNDLLFIGLVFFALAELAEGALPGIISEHIGFSKVIVFILVNLLAISFLGKLSEINLARKKINKKTAFLLILISILMVFNSLLDLSIWLNLFVLVIISAAIYYAYRVMLEG